MDQFAMERPWAIVLAGGDGTRLQTLTRKIEGDSRPKQFSKIFGGQSLLGQTRERLRSVINDDRMLFVVTKDHEPFYRRDLSDVDCANVLEQPANRGTGVAIIAALFQLLQYKPDGIVSIFPSDHYYADDAAFTTTVKSAISYGKRHHDAIVLIGAKPQWPEIEYGWIEPGRLMRNGSQARVFTVSRFREKPPLLEACDLMRRGGLWNTFVVVGHARALLSLLAAAVKPAMTCISDAFERRDLSRAYGEIETIDFSRDVLSREPRSLLVMEDAASGWADLGHPERVISTLDRHQIEPCWLREMRSSDLVRSKEGVHLRPHNAAEFQNYVTLH